MTNTQLLADAMVHRVKHWKAIASLACEPNFEGWDFETFVWDRTDPVSGKVTFDPMPYGDSHAHPFAGVAGSYEFYELDETRAMTHVCSMMVHMNKASSLDPMLVYAGHNLKFDIQHAPDISPVVPLWDTMVAEYLITGQRVKMASLADLCLTYGLAVKPDLIGSNLAAGITPDKIPQHELVAYMHGDAARAIEVAKAQWHIAKGMGLLELILVQSAATVAYALSELNGMPLNVQECVTRRDALTIETHNLKEQIADGIRATTGTSILIPDDEMVKPRSLSMFFFGIPRVSPLVSIPMPSAPPAGMKLRKGQKYLKLPLLPTQIVRAMPPDFIDLTHVDLLTAQGWYKTDNDVLQRVVSKAGTSHYGAIASKVIEWREKDKLLNTYYQPLLEHAAKYRDNTIHHTINQCIANTGRTTSEQPNAQNIPAAVREVVSGVSASDITRGGMLEMDFRQLEMCALAHLSGDTNLIQAILNGDDIHYMTGQLVFGYTCKSDETPESRRIIKTINFGLAYGGGAFTLAQQAGVSVQVARNAIEAFYMKFPGTKRYADDYFNNVCLRPEAGYVVPPKASDAIAITRRMHGVGSLTGRRYMYTEQDAPSWLQAKTGCAVAFSPTQTKNYPVQGFATGDIVPLAAALLMQNIAARLTISNLVHDSLLFRHLFEDDREEILDAIAAMVKALPEALEILWGIKMKVPLKVEVKEGPNWGTMKVIPTL